MAEAHSIEHSLRKEIALLSDDLSAAKLQLNDAHFLNSRLQASISCLEDEKVELKSRNR